MRLDSRESEELSTTAAPAPAPAPAPAVMPPEALAAGDSSGALPRLSTQTPVVEEEAMQRRNTPRMFTQKRSQRLRRLLMSERTSRVRGTVS